MEISPVTLNGRVVRLEPLTPAHGEAFATLGVEGDIFRYFPIALKTRDELLRYVEFSVGAQAAGLGVSWATVALASGDVIGGTSFLNIDPQNRRLEIGGTWIAPAWQGSACNAEAKYLQLRHAFEELGCIRVEFKTDSRNERSRAALRRIGATEEGTLRNHMIMPDGHLRHSVYFSIIDSEWPQVKANLETRIERLLSR
ncbi:MAG: GNAT family N-acetyltransferase [Deltaproteobacteria bacterium]|nr:GNAT family N-acetyltransferase [Deltaproteobacteria bacterium]MBI3390855.1 GNAT family N-acetyltransferase [Deltaproteobacteria bacterium]